MKRSEFIKRFAEEWDRRDPVGPAEDATVAARLAEAAGVTWDPEEPDGFREWFDAWDRDGVPYIPNLEEMARLAWNACLTHQEAQQRTIEPKVDLEVRRKEIEAQIAPYRSQLPHALVDRLLSELR